MYRNNRRDLPAFVESMSSNDWDPLGHLYLDAVFLEFSATWKVAAWCREMNENPLIMPTVTYTREIACIGFAEFRVLIQTASLDDLSTKSSAHQFCEQSNRWQEVKMLSGTCMQSFHRRKDGPLSFNLFTLSAKNARWPRKDVEETTLCVNL